MPPLSHPLRFLLVALAGWIHQQPMTYMIDGKRYIALTVGGNPPELITLTLPRGASEAHP